eukprot:COSAG05_NODE_1411_length_4958_cov_2.723400_5_plen_69_part_00
MLLLLLLLLLLPRLRLSYPYRPYPEALLRQAFGLAPSLPRPPNRCCASALALPSPRTHTLRLLRVGRQ